MKYVFVDTDNGGTPTNATPDTATSKYHTSSSWPANGARWSTLNGAVSDATVRGITDDLTILCQGVTDDTRIALNVAFVCASLTIQGDWTGGVFDASKYHIFYNSTLSSLIDNAITGCSVTVKNLQGTYDGSGDAQCFRLNVTSGAPTMLFDSVLLRHGGSNAGQGEGFRNAGSSGVIKCINCIATTYGTPGGNRAAYWVVSEAYNCIAYGVHTGFASCTTVKNCVSFGNTDDFLTCTTINYCAMDDSDSGTGNTNGKTWANEFEDYANGDFRLKAGSTLIGAGLDDPGSGLFSHDITGATRSDWDIGAFEYVAGGGGVSITSVTPSLFDDGHTGIVIAGSGFGASQGSSIVRINGVDQTVTAWSDTSITITAVRGGTEVGQKVLSVIKV